MFLIYINRCVQKPIKRGGWCFINSFMNIIGKNFKLFLLKEEDDMVSNPRNQIDAQKYMYSYRCYI